MVIRPVIVRGGSGTRSWSASRGSLSKPFVRLVIGDAEAFRQAIATAEGARAGRIVPLGIEPHRPTTAYGHIRRSSSLSFGQAYAVHRVVAKPHRPGAECFNVQGSFWNPRNFLFRADVMLAEFEAFAPAVLASARAALEQAIRDLDLNRLNAAAFAAWLEILLADAVTERSDRTELQPASFPRSDVGPWDTVSRVMERDAAGNAPRCRFELIETKGSLVQSANEGPTTVVRLGDVGLVTTLDTIPVASKSHSGQTKALGTQLQAMFRPEPDATLRTHRSRDWCKRIDSGEPIHVKRVRVVPCGRLPLLKHCHEAEHSVEVKGPTDVTVDERLADARERGDLPANPIHAPALEPEQDHPGADRGPSRSRCPAGPTLSASKNIYGR